MFGISGVGSSYYSPYTSYLATRRAQPSIEAQDMQNVAHTGTVMPVQRVEKVSEVMGVQRGIPMSDSAELNMEELINRWQNDPVAAVMRSRIQYVDSSEAGQADSRKYDTFEIGLDVAEEEPELVGFPGSGDEAGTAALKIGSEEEAKIEAFPGSSDEKPEIEAFPGGSDEKPVIEAFPSGRDAEEKVRFNGLPETSDDRKADEAKDVSEKAQDENKVAGADTGKQVNEDTGCRTCADRKATGSGSGISTAVCPECGTVYSTAGNSDDAIQAVNEQANRIDPEKRAEELKKNVMLHNPIPGMK